MKYFTCNRGGYFLGSVCIIAIVRSLHDCYCQRNVDFRQNQSISSIEVRLPNPDQDCCKMLSFADLGKSKDCYIQQNIVSGLRLTAPPSFVMLGGQRARAVIGSVQLCRSEFGQRGS